MKKMALVVAFCLAGGSWVFSQAVADKECKLNGQTCDMEDTSACTVAGEKVCILQTNIGGVYREDCETTAIDYSCEYDGDKDCAYRYEEGKCNVRVDGTFYCTAADNSNPAYITTPDCKTIYTPGGGSGGL